MSIPDASAVLSASDVNALRVQACVSIAGFCLMLYDILLTLDVEINLVWPAPRSAVKWLFLCNRYATPSLYIYVVNVWPYEQSRRSILVSHAGSLTTPKTYGHDSCFEFFLTSLTLEGFCVNGIGASLMLLRVYALYNRHRGILILLSALLILELLGAIIVMAYGVVAADYSMFFIEDIRACVSISHLSWLWIVFLFMMLYDVVIFYLVVRKTMKYARTTNVHTPLLSVLLVDSAGYFLVMIIAELLNIIAYTSFPSNLFLVGVNMMWSLNTVMVSRIYLNLRRAARPEDWSSLTAFKSYADASDETHATDDSGWTVYGSE
ncbi:hypothetical protein CALVIDRAFT_563258 [Calocera viscosa TUFC12733]|uniref:DUF6533 domain-containing protein n=1 Tax=Calocera viscosa (strain TUFC12733) TaxID=1330018 RepID=A0A167MT63_CALVF|nr:hypothetical protein CALVIDRAFT_563258 [Calocera viscosa TUFC12733]